MAMSNTDLLKHLTSKCCGTICDICTDCLSSDCVSGSGILLVYWGLTGQTLRLIEGHRILLRNSTTIRCNTLRDIYSTSSRFQEEVETITHTLHGLNGKTVLARSYLVPSTSNVITSLLFNFRYPKEHVTRVALDQLLRKAGRAITTGSIIVFLPSWMYRIAGMMPFTRINAVKTSFAGLLGFIRFVHNLTRGQLDV